VLLLFCALLGAVSGGKTGSAALRVGAASQLLTVAITLAALGALVAVAAVVRAWLAMLGSGTGTSGRRRRSTWLERVMSGMITGALIGLILIAMSTRHRHIATSPQGSGQGSPHGRVSVSAVSFRPGTSAATVGAVIGLFAVALLVAEWKRRRRRRLSNIRDLLDRSTGTSVFGPGSPEAAALAETFESLRIADPEEEADPRKAVVAAYLMMTQLTAAAGAQRRLDETPSEYLERLLADVGVSRPAAARLTVLFERARYSDVPVDESIRTDAIEALQWIRIELRVLSPERAAPGGATLQP